MPGSTVLRSKVRQSKPINSIPGRDATFEDLVAGEEKNGFGSCHILKFYAIYIKYINYYSVNKELPRRTRRE